MIRGSNATYAVATRGDGLVAGGIALVHQMCLAVRLPDAINSALKLFKRRADYTEADHVLNIAYNTVSGGICLEDIDQRRGDIGFLNALGAHRIPDQTTAGDFLRRFEHENDIFTLMEAINVARLNAWKSLRPGQRELATIDVDGTIAPTTGECKEGMNMSYKGIWGYHPLLVTLRNTQEVLYIANRSGNRPSHEDAEVYIDAAAELVRKGGFKSVRVRGDTDFAKTDHFDRWTRAGIEFVFGIDAHQSFKSRAGNLLESDWKPFIREPRPDAAGDGTRKRSENVKEIVIRERGYKSLATEREDYAEIEYTPGKSDQSYRMVILRKTIRVTEGQLRLDDEVRYFFYVTNAPRKSLTSTDVIRESNDRCDQENIIEQVKNELKALKMPTKCFLANWAYAVISCLAWNMKAWLGIMTTEPKMSRELIRMEFRRFLNHVMRIPVMVTTTGRRIVLKIVALSPWAKLLVDGMERFKRLCT